MRERALRRQCRRLLGELDIQAPLDVTELCHRLSRRRERPIQLLAHPIPVPGPFGCWISTQQADYIFYQQETTPDHQSHIILHELGHIISGHDSDESDDELLDDLYPDLEPDTVRRALRRTAYDTEQEREAETVATIIKEWASVLDRVAMNRTTDDSVNALGTSLSDRRGWL